VRMFVATNTGEQATSKATLDCGTTEHMFEDRDRFISYALVSGETTSVDAHDVPVAGRGSIVLRCRLSNGIRTVVLHGVLHVPQLAMNLVSLGRL